MSKNYSELIDKIEVFIRKYYKNQLIKGAIISLALIISFFLLIRAIKPNPIAISDTFSWHSIDKIRNSINFLN